MRNVKVTAAQIIAMREATMREDGSYELTTAKGQTIASLVRAGVVVEGTRFLTVQGVSVMHSVSDVSVIASKGYKVSVSDDDASMTLFTLPTPVEPVADAQSVVTITDMPSVPDMSADLSVCYWACENTVTGAFCDYVGRTEGVCDEHAYRVTSPITLIALADWERELLTAPVPEFVREVTADENIAQSEYDNEPVRVETIAVIQNAPGNYGTTHYHAPECRDIKREMKRFGQREGDVFSLAFTDVAEILVFEYSDVASDENEVNSREWWSSIFYNANASEYGGIKIMPCLTIPAGTTSDGSPIVTDGNLFREGFKAPSVEREDGTDGGFVETMVTKEYDLSVIVDDSTGAMVSLGWVTLTMNAAQADDTDRIAEAYGAAHGTGTPRHGWASIIVVNEVCDL